MYEQLSFIYIYYSCYKPFWQPPFTIHVINLSGSLLFWQPPFWQPPFRRLPPFWQPPIHIHFLIKAPYLRKLSVIYDVENKGLSHFSGDENKG